MSQHPEIDKWVDLATKQMRGKPLESLDWQTPEGIKVKPCGRRRWPPPSSIRRP